MRKIHLINQLAGQGQRPYLFCKRKYKHQIKEATWSMLEFLEGNYCKDCYKEYAKTRDLQPSLGKV
jgi:hypothetical protein